MLSHTIEGGVLVIRLRSDPDTDERAALALAISDLVHTYRQYPVVITLDGEAATSAAVSAVIRAHHMCNHLGVVMSVATDSAPARRLLEANADTGGTRMVIHARVDTAITAAFAAAA
ncbi:hypothetical protein ACFYP4_21860 [Streptomyces sp. NPDC005551]|uniref:hypothetical protein n=1 Tax=unclassified Streptomyces TaxID=2593676 RepID=UPI0033CF0E87